MPVGSEAAITSLKCGMPAPLVCGTKDSDAKAATNDLRLKAISPQSVGLRDAEMDDTNKAGDQKPLEIAILMKTRRVEHRDRQTPGFGK